MLCLILWGQYILSPAIPTSKCSVWFCEDNTSYILPYLSANALSDPVRTIILSPAIPTSKCSVWSCEDNTSYLLPYLPANAVWSCGDKTSYLLPYLPSNALSDPVRTIHPISCHTCQQMLCLILWELNILSPAILPANPVWSCEDKTSYLLPYLPANAMSDPVRTIHPISCHTYQ